MAEEQMTSAKTDTDLASDNADLRRRLEEAEETLHAIRSGQIDALVVTEAGQEQVFTLETADRPYRTLVEAMQQGAGTLASDGTVLYSNQRLADLLATPLQTLMGQSLDRFVSPTSRPALAALLREGRSGPAQEEIAFCRENGSILPAYVAVNVLPLAEVPTLCMVVTDLTERKQHEEVVAAEALARSILEQAADAVVVCDRSGRIIRASHAARALCTDSPLYSDFESAFPLRYDGDPERGSAEANGTSRGEPVTLASVLLGRTLRSAEVFLERPAGAPTSLLLSAARLISPENQVMGVVITLTDITERKRAEEALRDADRRKDEFLAMLAHELRNPLAPIRNGLQILKIPGLPRGQLDRAREILERQVGHMTRLIDDLLDVSRITRGKVQLAREPLELAAIIGRAVEVARPLLDARRHQLTVSLPAEPVRVDGDAVRLAQVFANLLNNAAKFMAEGGEVAVTAQQADGEVAVCVRDKGVGIRSDMINQVFELFTQVDPTLARSQGGLGIGLTLVRSLVEMHGGRVEALSEGLGKGSTFVVRLPTLADPSRGGKEGPLAAARAEAADGRPHSRILVIEDNRDSALMLAELVRAWGHEVHMAYDGVAGLLAARDLQPQIVLLDIGLPGMNGYEVARELRKTPGLEESLIVALTGYGQVEDRQRAQASGVNVHLVKPADPDVLQPLLDLSCSNLGQRSR
jgi:PAS domain S-box-containing protein